MSSSFGINALNRVFSWGSNQFAKLGHQIQREETQQYSTAQTVLDLQNVKIIEIAAGPFHTLALSEDGKLFVFGHNKDGKLGLMNKEKKYITPTQIDPKHFKVHTNYEIRKKVNAHLQKKHTSTVNLSNQDQIIQVVATESNSYFLSKQGELYACGKNEYKLCMQSVQGYDQDFKEELEKRITKKGEHSMQQGEELNLAVLQDEVVDLLDKYLKEYQCFEDVWRPTKIIFNKDLNKIIIKHVAASTQHVLVTTDTGKVWVWGNNNFGQLGLNKVGGTCAEPKLVKAIREIPIKMCAAGTSHSVLLTNYGQVYTCGRNNYGQLGCEDELQLQLGDMKQDEQLEENKIEIYLNTMQRNLPTQLKTLANVQFICCSSESSMALSLQESGLLNEYQRIQNLYTWGKNSFGQLGTGDTKNSSVPVQVLFPRKMVDVISISAANKHTLALDERNQIWFFGLKENVGIQSKEKIQTEPSQLRDKDRDRKFSLINAGENINLAVDKQIGNVLTFGKSKINASTQGDFISEIIFEPLKQNQSAQFYAQQISCGRNHYLAINQQQVYSWGDNHNGKCGVQLIDESKNLTNQTATQLTISQQPIRGGQNKIIDYPTRVDFDQNLNQQRNFVKDQNPKNLCPDGQDVKFEVQTKLQKNSVGDLEQIIKQDDNLKFNFNKVCKEFNNIVNQIYKEFKLDIINCQDAVVSRLLTMPTKIKLVKKLKNQKPGLEIILRNKQLFEALFTLLQVHPCYILKLHAAINEKKENFKNGACEKFKNRVGIHDTYDVMKYLLLSIFGANSIVDNQRIITTLQTMSLVILDQELEMRLNHKKEKVIHKNEIDLATQQQTLKIQVLQEFLIDRNSAFRCLFSLVFQNQSQNKKFCQDFIRDLQQKQSEEQEFDQGFWIVQKLDDCFDRMNQIKGEDKRHKGQSLLSFEITDLLISAYKKLTYNCDEDVISSVDEFVLVLIIDEIQNQMDNCFKSAEVDADFKFNQIKRQNQKANKLEIRRDLIQRYTKKPDDKVFDFRKHFANFDRKNDLSLELVFQMFHSSCELIDYYHTIRIRDMLAIFSLIQDEKILLDVTVSQTDPLKVVIQAFGLDAAKLQAEDVCCTANRKINLVINYKLLVNQSEFVKCQNCNAPVTKQLLAFNKRFEQAFYGKEWECQECKKDNNQFSFQCARCKEPMPKYQFPKDLVFKRFSFKQHKDQCKLGNLTQNKHYNDYLKQKEPTAQFQEILIFLPLIEYNNDFEKMLEFEIKRQRQDLEEISDKKKKGESSLKTLSLLEDFRSNLQKHLEEKRDDSNEKDNTGDEYFKELECYINHQLQDREDHASFQKQLEQQIKSLDFLKKLVVQKRSLTQQENKKFVKNAYTGLSSNFLNELLLKNNFGLHNIDKSKRFWSGRLQDKSNSVENKKKTEQVAKRNNQSIGTFELQKLQKKGVIKDIPDQTIDSVKKQSIVFVKDLLADNRTKVGLAFELVYFQTDSFDLVSCAKKQNEIVLNNFQISLQSIYEMRRNFATHQVAKFGNIQFDIFALVRLINKLTSASFFEKQNKTAVQQEEKKQENHDGSDQESEAEIKNKEADAVKKSKKTKS